MSATIPRPVVYREPRPTAWLWKVALLIAFAAGGVIMLLREQLPDPAAEHRIHLVGAVAAIAIGLCAISATAGRWIKH